MRNGVSDETSACEEYRKEGKNRMNQKTFPRLRTGLALVIVLTIQKPGVGIPADRLSYLMSFFNSTHGRFI